MKYISTSDNSIEIKVIIILFVIFESGSSFVSLGKLNYIYSVIKFDDFIDYNNLDKLELFDIERDLKLMINICINNKVICTNSEIKKTSSIKFGLTDKGKDFCLDVNKSGLFTDLRKDILKILKYTTQKKIDNYRLTWK